MWNYCGHNKEYDTKAQNNRYIMKISSREIAFFNYLSECAAKYIKEDIASFTSVK